MNDVMVRLSNHTSFDKREISVDELYIAIFNINNNGPNLLEFDNNLSSKLTLDNSLTKAYLTQFGIYSMVGISQGNYYQEGVYYLPCGKIEGYRTLLISLLATNNSTDNLHLNYYHIAIFIDNSTFQQIPQLSIIEEDVLTKLRSIFPITNPHTIVSEIKELLIPIINRIESI